MERLCSERVSQFERDLEEKNSTIVALTKEKLEHLRAIDALEERLGTLDACRK